MIDVMTEIEEILDKGPIIETEWYSSFRGRPRGYNKPRGSYKRQENERDTSDGRQQWFRIQTRWPARRPRVETRSPCRDKDRCLSCREFGNFAKDCPGKGISAVKAKHREERSSKCIGCSYLYEGDPEEEDKEEKGRINGTNAA